MGWEMSDKLALEIGMIPYGCWIDSICKSAEGGTLATVTIDRHRKVNKWTKFMKRGVDLGAIN